MIASIGLNIVPADDLGIRKAISHFYYNDVLQSSEIVRSLLKKSRKRLRDCIVYLLMTYRMRL